MQDLYQTQIGLEAEIAYRRRQAIAIYGNPSSGRHLLVSLRTLFADGLAHLALHIDGRALSSVTARHSHSAGHGHGRAA